MPLRVAIALAVAAMFSGACSSDPTKGYTFASTYREDVRTIHVPIFQNTTFSHGLERELTDAVIKEIRRTTPWSVVSSDTAQTTLTGTITDSRMSVLSRSRESGMVQELAVQMTVEFQWKDNRSGLVLVSRRGFRASESFVPASGVQERLEVGQHAGIQELARDIVSELRSSW